MQLLQAGKLAVVGEVASGMAHELNQPLMVMRARVQQLFPLVDEPVRERLERIEKQTHKMENIINHMRSFSRQSRDERRPVQLNQIVDEALLLMGDQLRNLQISLVLDLDLDLPFVLADAGQLEQVLLNLLSNARDALAGRPGPRITITTRVLDSAPRLLALTVTDNGVGIPTDALARIFEPFFTTKAEGVGTGLGLSISRGIIERHDGHIDVVTGADTGTTFRIALPALVHDEADPASFEQPTPPTEMPEMAARAMKGH
jgi:C4-dicarboxylate-specific signal transduction histidine kinase